MSLRTKDEAEARTLLNARNESFRQPVLNRQIARTYLAATDSAMATRIWQVPMDEMTKTKTGSTRVRHECAMKDKAFDLIRNLPILETHAQQFLGDLDDVRTCLQKAHRAAALIYAHFKKEFGLPDK